MHPIFMAAVIAHGGTDSRIEAKNLPGSIPANIRPPGEPAAEPPTGSTMSLASSDSRPAPAPRSQVASAGSGGMFGGLFSSSGDSPKSTDSQPGVFDRFSKLLHGPDGATTDAVPAPKAKPVAGKPTQTASAAPGAIRPKPAATTTATQPDTKSTNAGAIKPATTPAEAQPVETANNTTLLRGAAPPVPSGGFDSRWGAMR
jgi:hypothetical protein